MKVDDIFDEAEKAPMTAKKAQKILKEEGVEVTMEHAEKILEFLNKLANIAMDVYLKHRRDV